MTLFKIRNDNFRVVAQALIALMLIGCGGGSDSNTAVVPANSSAVNDATNVGPANEIGSSNTDSPNTGSQVVNATASNSDFPFSGNFVADEYSPGFSSRFEGIIEITPSPLTKTRILSGSMPRRYPDGRTTYREGCGQGVTRISLAESTGLSTPITPCSSEVPNEGFSPTDFRQSSLSPDGTKIAVETRAYIGSGYRYATLVYEVASQSLLAGWSGYNGTWTPEGRLLLATDEGLYLLDANLENPQKLGDEINGVVGNPDVNPNGTAIVFEFNQQIWGMNIDGSSARQLIIDGSRLRFPVWAPDGSTSVAYLSLPSDDKYLGFIFVADFESNQAYGLDLAPVLEFGSSNFLRTINGPLSWNQ